MNRSVYLKVKVKSLAEEAKIIRKEERKCKLYKETELLNGLHLHRTRIVRSEARATLVAYGYMKGKDYRRVEPNAKKEPDWAKVKSMVNRYCDFEAKSGFDAWMKVGIS